MHFGKEGWTVMDEKTVGLEEKLAGLLAEAKKKKNVLEYQEIMDFLGTPPPDADQLDRIFEFLDQNSVDVLRVDGKDDLDPDLFLEEELEEEEEVPTEPKRTRMVEEPAMPSSSSSASARYSAI